MEKIAKRIARKHQANTKNTASIEQTNGARITAEDVERIIGRRRAIWKGTCKLRPTTSSEMTNKVRFPMMTPGWTRLIGVVRIFWAADSGAAVLWCFSDLFQEKTTMIGNPRRAIGGLER